MRSALFMVLVIGGVFAAQAAEKYHIHGGSVAARENVQKFLNAQSFSEQTNKSQIYQQTQKNTREALKALGYFQSDSDITVSGEAPDWQIDVKLDPGRSVDISQLDWQVTGPIADDPEFQSLVKAHPLSVGEPFNSGDYESLKSAISSYAAQHGYFDGELTQNKVQVSLAEHRADITLHYRSGPRYRIGHIVFSQPNIPREMLIALAPFHSGDPYDAEQIAKFSRALNKTNYFKSIMVTPMLSRRHDGVIDLEVVLTRKPSDIFSVGLGFSTDQGVQGQLSWEHPWVNRYGHSLSASLEASQIEQTLSGEYRIPVTNPVNDYIALQGGYRRELDDESDTDSRRYTVSLLRRWYIDEQWTPHLEFQTLYENYRQGNQQDSTLLFMPGFSLSRKRIEGSTSDPDSGDLISIFAQTANEAWLSDVNLTKVRIDTKWLRSLKRHRVIARASFGAIFVDDIDKVPASMRFFAGGDQSIRGYDYKSISPKDSEGELVGGKYLATASLEYNYQFAQKWRVAAFYDAGTAANDLHHRMYAGTGLGIRWLTPIGPVRIDVAKGLVDAPDEWRLHFSLGPDL